MNNDMEKIKKLIGNPQSYREIYEKAVNEMQVPENRQALVDLLRSWRREDIAELDSMCCGLSASDYIDAR
jgi:hypothetical protein